MVWNKKITKTIYLLNVNGYAPEITELTYPFIEKYAKKIDADIFFIRDRKFPGYPPVYEKLQIYEIAQRLESDWNLYIDSDTLVHPDMPDVTNLVSKDTVLHNGIDFAPIRWKYDRFFLRDGRHIGSCNWFTMASDLCLELWKPLDDLTLEEALENIYPTTDELATVVTREHLLDDYVLSRNIAKYGLKAITYSDLLQKFGNPGDFLWHQYQMTTEEKVQEMKNVISLWGKTHTQIKREQQEAQARQSETNDRRFAQKIAEEIKKKTINDTQETGSQI